MHDFKELSYKYNNGEFIVNLDLSDNILHLNKELIGAEKNNYSDREVAEYSLDNVFSFLFDFGEEDVFPFIEKMMIKNNSNKLAALYADGLECKKIWHYANIRAINENEKKLKELGLEKVIVGFDKSMELPILKETGEKMLLRYGKQKVMEICPIDSWVKQKSEEENCMVIIGSCNSENHKPRYQGKSIVYAEGMLGYLWNHKTKLIE
jgi:hypothetical protein